MKRLRNTSSEVSRPQEQSEELLKLRFHNYNPRTEELKRYCEEADEPDALLNKIMETQDALLRSFSRKFADPSLDLDHMVPRTGNWDMKRSLNRKLERLERRTHRAIIKAVQQKQQEEKKFQSTEVTLIPSSSDEE